MITPLNPSGVGVSDFSIAPNNGCVSHNTYTCNGPSTIRDACHILRSKGEPSACRLARPTTPGSDVKLYSGKSRAPVAQKLTRTDNEISRFGRGRHSRDDRNRADY